MIVENSVQLEEFKRTYDTEDCILIPIQLDDNKHSVSDKLSLLYVQMWGGKEFMPVSYTHLTLPTIYSV